MNRKSEKEFTIRDVGAYTVRDRGVTVLVLICLVVIVSLVMWFSTPKYRATMIVAPAENGLIQQTSSFGSVSGLSQLLNKQNEVTPFQIYLKYYSSTELAAMLDRQHGLMKIIFAKQWDNKNAAWKPRAGLLAMADVALHKLYGVSYNTVPTIGDLRDYLARAIVITPGDEEEMQTVSFMDRDPLLARQVLQWAHEAAETLTRSRMQVSTAANIRYLQGKIATVTLADQRTSLGSLLTAQESKLMMLQSWNGYASDVVEAPVPSDRPVSPNPPLLLVLAILGGIVIGALISTGRMFVGITPSSSPFAVIKWLGALYGGRIIGLSGQKNTG